MNKELKLLGEKIERKLRAGDFLDGPALVPNPLGGDRSIAGFQDQTAGRPAAVLIPLVARKGGALSIFFTQRPETMKEHPGQISFPGGRQARGDASAVETALREAKEEIGLAPKQVEIIGRLSPYHTITGYRVTPVVGLVEGAFTPRLDPREVADAFTVPLTFFLDKAHAEKHTRIHEGNERPYYAFRYNERTIWGATAAMLINFREALLVYGQ